MSEDKVMTERENDEARQAGAGAPAPAGDDGDEISLIDLAATIWRRKWLIVAITAIAAAGSVLYALRQPNLYTASATILPISSSSSTASLLSQYAGLASMAGVSLPSGGTLSSATKIEAILKSRSFAEKLVDKLDLGAALIEHPERIKIGTPRSAAIEALQEGTLSISTDQKTFLMKISAKTKSAELSSAIANSALDLIQQDLAGRVLSSSGRNIALMEQQAAEQEKKVRSLQDKLAAYQKKNKLIAPQAQSAGSLQLYQSLIQQKITGEIEISRLESALSSDNPKLVAARTQLDAVKQQIADFEKTGGGVGPSMSDTPAALMAYANITAELELATKVYGGILTSLETMKLQDATEKVFVEVIDKAIPPEKKSEPSRAMICVVGTMAGGFFSILLVFVLDALKKLVADPEVRGKFAPLKRKAG